MVGSANGRSISELTMFLPGKSSRTSTQAISVPNTALMSTTISDAISVSFSAATACGLLTAVQKLSVPLSSDFTITAASGISATTLKYASATPRPRAAPGMATALGPRLTGAAGGAAAVAALVGGSALSLVLEDLRHHALLRVEEVGVHLVPAAELRDVEQVGRLRELVGAGRVLHDGAVPLAHEDPLGLLGVEEVDERLRERGILGLAGRGDRVLDEDGLLGHDVVEILALLLREDRLVLVAQQHVALAAREGLERLAGALLELRAVGRHDVPLRAAGGERVRREHLYVGRHEVVPVLDALRVALADHEDHDRVRDVSLVLVLAPALVDEVRVHEPRHVRLERELDDVGRQAALHRARLLAGCGVGLAEADALAL